MKAGHFTNTLTLQTSGREGEQAHGEALRDRRGEQQPRKLAREASGRQLHPRSTSPVKR